MTAPFFFVIVALVLFGAVTVARKRSLVVDRHWGKASDLLGLRYVHGSLFGEREMQGTVDGFRVRVYTYTRSTGKSSAKYTCYRVDYPPLDVAIGLTSEGFMSGLKKAFGARDIEVGDPLFDNAVLVKGSPPEDVRRYLTPWRRDRIHHALKRFDGCEITTTGIQYAHRTSGAEAESIVSTVRAFTRLAEALQAQEQPLTPDGDLDAGRGELARDASVHEDADASASTGPLLLAGSRGDVDGETVEQLVWELPDDQEVAVLDAEAQPVAEAVQEAPHASDAPETRPSANPLARDPTERSVLTDVAATCDELFDANRMSAEVGKLFDSNFAGRTVRWAGTLDRLDDFTSDTVFGKGPGTRAVVALHVVDNGLYSGREVRGVVQLPREAGAALRDRRGERIEFEGRLASCDPFMRNLFVADAELR